MNPEQITHWRAQIAEARAADYAAVVVDRDAFEVLLDAYEGTK